MAQEIEQVAAALPSYEIGGQLGRGSSGVVFAARHRGLQRDVAVKVLPGDVASDPDVRRRFVAEARLLGSFSHPHIVPIYDFVEQDGLCLLVMERLAGGTLDGYARAGLDGPGSCVALLAVCSGLQYAHERGVLHRDIKPGNVLVAEDGVVKVTDFGIAKVLGGTETVVTRAGFVLGTPAYMAPEQAKGTEPGPATDVYGAATMLYELLAGRLPYDSESPLQMLYTRVHLDPHPLRSVAPEVPVELAEVIMRALAREPADRHASAEEFAVGVGSAATTAWGLDWLRDTPFRVAAAGGIATAAHGGSLGTVPETITDTPSGDGGATAAPGSAVVAGPSGCEAPPPDAPPPALDPGAGAPLAPPRPARPPNRRRIAVVLGVMALLVVAAGLVALLAGGDDGGAPQGATTGGPPAATPNTAAAKAWQALTPSGEARQQAPGTVKDGSVWVLGGLGNGPAGVTTALKSVQVFDPALGQWHTGPELPVELHHAMAVTYDDEVVVLGGWTPEGSNLSARASKEVYGQQGNRWEPLEPMPVARAAGGAAAVGDKIVVVGGQANQELVSTTAIFDGTSWTEGAPMTTPLEHLAVATDGRYVYAIGGRRLDAEKNSNVLQRYDPANDSWARLPNLPKPVGGLGAAYVQGRIVAVGGETLNSVRDTSFIYDIRKREWRVGPKLTRPRHGMSVAATADTVYALDGALAPLHTQSTDIGESLTFAPRGEG